MKDINEELDRIACQIAEERLKQGVISYGFKIMLEANPKLSSLVRKKIDERHMHLDKSL